MRDNSLLSIALMAEASVPVETSYVSTATVIYNGEEKTQENAVVRRIGKYHANVWESDFLRSLSSPYAASLLI